MQGLLVGVDAGGTSTRVAAWDPASGDYRSTEGVGANWTVHGPQACRETIEALCREVVAAGDVRSIAICMAGYFPPLHEAEVLRWMRETWPGSQHRPGTDLEAALAGAHEGRPGLVLIAGTGSVCMGVSSQGRTARAGGWGPLVGDPGSAHWVGQEALRHVAEAADRGEQTGELGRTLGTGDTPEAAALWLRDRYRLGWAREEVAGLARTVSAAAEAGDVTARSILRLAGVELARLVLVVQNRLDERDLPVSVQGGLWAAQRWLKLEAHLGLWGVPVTLTSARRSGLQGAVLLAGRSLSQADALRFEAMPCS